LRCLTDLKTVLTEFFHESIIQNEQFQQQIKKGEWVFVPIPLSAEILAKELSKKFSFPVQELLIRTREIKIQMGLTNLQRKLNV
jgi:hypothetical protein